MKKGNYFGTEIDGKWWKRYRAPAFFARGNGEFWMDEEGIHFLKLLTKTPLTIAWPEASGASLGRSHAGRWVLGRPVLKVAFRREGQALEAGFYLGGDWSEMEALVTDLNRRIG